MVSVKIRKRRVHRTGGVLHKFNWIGAEPAVQGALDECSKRREANDKGDYFGPFIRKNFVHLGVLG